jgi:hypothetical protein
MFAQGIVRLVAALTVCLVLLPPGSFAQQRSDLGPLAEELLKRLEVRDGAASADGDQRPEATEEVSDGPVIPPPQEVPTEPLIATTPLPPVRGPEADLARRLLAITDSEENQEEIREEIARDFVRRLSRPLLEVPEEEIDSAPSQSTIILAENDSGIPDGEELIFEVRIDNRRFVQSLFGIKQGDGIYVDLAEASSLLEFAIDVDPDAGTARGFFIRPENTFALDLDAGTVAIEGETINVSQGDVLRRDDSIFVHSDTFAVWFGVRLDVDFRELAVAVVPEAPLPLQQRFLRQERIASLRQSQRPEPSLPRLDDPYRPISWPLADVRLQSTLQDSPGQPLRTTQNYSVVGRGDLGFATSEFFFGGNQDDFLNSGRLTLKREDPTGGLLGPLQATSVEAGDVTAPGLPVNGTGVGAFISNNTTGIQNLGSTTDFIGNEQPGTDIELYRNGILLDLITVGDDGRYEFRNVPLLLGENEFRIVFYGAQGEIREQRESRTVTSAGENTGLPIYSAAVFKPGNPLLPIEDIDADDGPLASALLLQRSFANGISANAGLSFVDTGRPSTGQLSAGISAPFLDGSASATTTQNFGGGWSATTSYRTRSAAQSVGLTYQTTRDSGSSNQDSFNADLTGDIPLFAGLEIPYSLSVGRTYSANGTVQDRAQVRNSSGLGRYRVSHAFEWSRLDPSGSATQRTLTGNLQNTLLLTPVSLRIGANYRLIEDRELQRVDGDINWTVNNRAQLRFGYQRFVLSGRKAYSLGGNYRFDRFLVSPSLSYDSNNQFFALVSVSFSAGRDPISGRVVTDGSTFTNGGVVAAMVYRDDNLNRQYDPGEPLIEDAQIEAVHANRTATTSEDGVAYLSRLPPYLLTDVRVRPGTLPDPFMAPLNPGQSLLPRPGRTNVMDFPVTLTSEVEGSVVALRDGELTPLAGALVELRNDRGEVVATQETLFDGFFLFINVFPGEYSLHLLPDNVESEGFVVPPPRRLSVDASGTPILGVEIVTGPEGVDLPPPSDARIAAVVLGRFPTIESARAGLELYRGLYPERLARLGLMTPLEAQQAPYELRLGRVSQGAADDICIRMEGHKVPCAVVVYPYEPDPPLVPVLRPVAGATPGTSLAAAAPSDSPADLDESVIVDLGRYPDAARAEAAWALLQRLYADLLVGARRQPSAGNDLVVGVMPLIQGEAFCSAVIDIVPTCAISAADAQPAPLAPAAIPSRPTVPMVQESLPTLSPAPVIADAREGGETPRVAAVPVEEVAVAPLRPIAAAATTADETPAESTEDAGTVVAVRLGEYGSQVGVDTGWQLLRRRYPDVLGEARLLGAVDPAETKRPLLAGPFTELNALAICARLIADGQSCRVARARI